MPIVFRLQMPGFDGGSSNYPIGHEGEPVQQLRENLGAYRPLNDAYKQLRRNCEGACHTEVYCFQVTDCLDRR